MVGANSAEPFQHTQGILYKLSASVVEQCNVEGTRSQKSCVAIIHTPARTLCWKPADCATPSKKATAELLFKNTLQYTFLTDIQAEESLQVARRKSGVSRQLCCPKCQAVCCRSAKQWQHSSLC